MKGGASVNIADVRTLDDMLARDTASSLVVLIVMGELGPAKTRNFEPLMAGHAALDLLGVRYPWMQMLTMVEVSPRIGSPRRAWRHGASSPRV